MTQDEARQKAINAGVEKLRGYTDAEFSEADLRQAFETVIDTYIKQSILPFLNEAERPIISAFTRCDYFSGHALTGLLSNGNSDIVEFTEVIRDAYHIGKLMDEMAPNFYPIK
ncbi:hypothetical protein [Bartonella sp. HY038]|uniref:hypothetical protein n=1 Tax=Bartonella sp. HY038 TaxID=2759660 RepID=UPI0015FB8DBC|nr:hypothetical protein [Bartonella sp. HY038]